MKLLIAIPAYNEEDSIADTIRDALAARDRLVHDSPITTVDITVVSDGSTDRTVERARDFAADVRVVTLDHNCGYGAAIKRAWGESDADLLGVLDADGTCDPRFFVDLCCAMEREDADLALGSRMHRASKIPLARRVGNVFFAAMVTAISSSRVRDAATGMRVVRASSLPQLLPLPDGMQFTPAMTARASLNERLKIVEIDMPYHERVGQSKLRVLRDGLRFLWSIIETALTHRPSRLFVTAGVVVLILPVVLMTPPIEFYLVHRRVLEWMIYRFVVSELTMLAGVLLIAGGYLAGRMSAIAVESRRGGVVERGAARFLRSHWFWAAPVTLVLAGGALVLPSALQLVRTGATYEHWSKFIVMSTLVGIAILLVVVRLLDFVLDLLSERVTYLRNMAGENDGSQRSLR
jgi:glycosyltransferase involved in cell wall biosynthesis